MRTRTILIAAAVLVATGATAAHATPGQQPRASTITGSGLGSGGDDLVVAATDAARAPGFVEVCDGYCEPTGRASSLGNHLALACSTLVSAASTSGTRATWVGAAYKGDWFTYGDPGWFLVRVDFGRGRQVDRLGVDFVADYSYGTLAGVRYSPTDAGLLPPPSADDRCGAWGVKTRPLVAGDFVLTFNP